MKPWVTFVGCVLVVVVLYWAQAVLVPIARAVLLTFVLTPAGRLARALARPRPGCPRGGHARVPLTLKRRDVGVVDRARLENVCLGGRRKSVQSFLVARQNNIGIG